ncbi:MAG: hypothetical protein ONA90_07290, partial [candidate division KSB1 bacterium]|nr:hypothetical protein [candidate division KSB1 bacterium]
MYGTLFATGENGKARVHHEKGVFGLFVFETTQNDKAMYSKRMLLLLIVYMIWLPLFLPNTLHAQGWQWQNPLPFGNPLFGIDFVDSLNGWFTGSAGTVLHTSDGGKTWIIQRTGQTDA